ncbi:unnamed protein product [Pedinophyceae sp. YPF-701]|nr:unnamed protein product [Pedinophyceae sp. YPF-701]
MWRAPVLNEAPWGGGLDNPGRASATGCSMRSCASHGSILALDEQDRAAGPEAGCTAQGSSHAHEHSAEERPTKSVDGSFSFDDAHSEGFESALCVSPQAADVAPNCLHQERLAAGCDEHGCEHYRRRCKLRCPDCDELFWCRFCHNAAKNDEEPDVRKRHTLDRHRVRSVECALCGTEQPVGTSCRSCGAAFGRYACLKCNFFDDDVSKEQFHCDKCGICRVGGAEHFWHCDRCEACFEKNGCGEHKCVESATKQDCPVCLEYLFDSTKSLHVLVCGHVMHRECFDACCASNNYRCPWCQRTMFVANWEFTRQQIEATPMPEEYRNTTCHVLCNDCAWRGQVAWHVLGMGCGHCGSYNTARI